VTSLKSSFEVLFIYFLDGVSLYSCGNPRSSAVGLFASPLRLSDARGVLGAQYGEEDTASAQMPRVVWSGAGVYAAAIGVGTGARDSPRPSPRDAPAARPTGGGEVRRALRLPSTSAA